MVIIKLMEIGQEKFPLLILRTYVMVLTYRNYFKKNSINQRTHLTFGNARKIIELAGKILKKIVMTI